MSQQNNGGSAFPTTVYYDDKQVGVEEGVTKRDYFAAKALTGMLGQPANAQNYPVYDDVDRAAILAYEFADAMLKERSR